MPRPPRKTPHRRSSCELSAEDARRLAEKALRIGLARLASDRTDWSLDAIEAATGFDFGTPGWRAVRHEYLLAYERRFDRPRRAWYLRKTRGYTWEKIARLVGYADRGSARRAAMRAAEATAR